MRKLLRFIRNNAVGFIALIVACSGTAYAANTIGSSDIIDGEVKSVDIGSQQVKSIDIGDGQVATADLGDATVNGNKVYPNSLGGAHINENSLGPVPTAKTLNGYSEKTFVNLSASFRQKTGECDNQANIWKMCTPITLFVPSGRIWVVTITSSFVAGPGNITGAETFFCPATDGPTCASTPDRVSLPANLFTSASRTETKSVTGTVALGTTMKPNVAL